MKSYEYLPYTEAVQLHPSEYSAWIDQQVVTTAADQSVPNAPTVVADAADQAIELTITPPSLNTDETVFDDFDYYKVYYSSGTPVTTGDDYFKTTTTKHVHATASRVYFAVSVVDKWGNESALSAEDDDEPTSAPMDVAVDDYPNNIETIVAGYEIIGIKFQPPKSSWVRWGGWKLYAEDDGGTGTLPVTPSWVLIYEGADGAFLYKGLDATYKYEFKVKVVAEDGTETTGTVDDNSSAGYQPNDSVNYNDLIIAEDIWAERMVCTTEFFGQNILVAASGVLRSGQTAWDTGVGWWLGDAASTPKFSIGHSSGAKMTWDGTNLLVQSATLTASLFQTAADPNDRVVIGPAAGPTNEDAIAIFDSSNKARFYLSSLGSFQMGDTAGTTQFQVLCGGSATDIKINENATTRQGSILFYTSAAWMVMYEGGTIEGDTGKTIDLNHCVLDINDGSSVTGTLAVANIPNLPGTIITSSGLNATYISTGTLAAARLASTLTSNITKASLTLTASSGSATLDAAAGNVVLDAGSGYVRMITNSMSSYLDWEDYDTSWNPDTSGGGIKIRVGGTVRYIQLYVNP